MQTPLTHSLNGDSVGVWGGWSGGIEDDKATGQAGGDGRVGTRSVLWWWVGGYNPFFYYTTLSYNNFY